MVIIGLSGYARSGKDEAAKVLVEKYGFQRIAFADKLRDFLYELNPIVSDNEPLRINVKVGVEVKTMGIPGYENYTHVYVQDVIDHYGWDGYKESKYGPEVRRLLQRLGTEAGRNVLWDSIWIDAAFADTRQGGNYVITDARFPNEAEAIRERGGRLFRIERAGVGPANSHASETSLDNYDFDAFIHNDGTLEEFRKSVERRYLEFLGR